MTYKDYVINFANWKPTSPHTDYPDDQALTRDSLYCFIHYNSEYPKCRTYTRSIPSDSNIIWKEEILYRNNVQFGYIIYPILEDDQILIPQNLFFNDPNIIKLLSPRFKTNNKLIQNFLLL